MSRKVIGIRLEDKNRWERRVALTPQAVGVLMGRGDLDVHVQSSPIRAFRDDEYRAAGASVVPELGGCDVVFAVKEVPIHLFREGTTYVFFSHTVKGQHHNMPMLRALMDKRCSLIDYERVVDEKNRRLIFFGWFAGAAGMIETLTLLGKRLAWLGHATPFLGVHPAHDYPDLHAAEEGIRRVGRRLQQELLPAGLAPLVFGIAGYGNVSQGAQHILHFLPFEEIQPSDLPALRQRRDPPRDRVFKVVFREEDMAEDREGLPFDLQRYYREPARFRGTFERHVPHLDVLVNGIFWTGAYPRLLSLDLLRRHTEENRLRLSVIGDISCDIDGSVECTVKSTTPDVPAFVWDPLTGVATDGHEGPGVAVMAVDNLPCELPREASEAFSAALLPHAAAIAHAEWSAPTEALVLPDPIRRALILHRGALTPEYRFMERYLS